MWERLKTRAPLRINDFLSQGCWGINRRARSQTIVIFHPSGSKAAPPTKLALICSVTLKGEIVVLVSEYYPPEPPTRRALFRNRWRVSHSDASIVSPLYWPFSRYTCAIPTQVPAPTEVGVFLFD